MLEPSATAPPAPAAGLFVVLEGGEGAGKSTQAGLLARWLGERGHAVVTTREPGGSPVGEAVRAVLLDPANHGLSHRAEALLFAAARGEHVHRLIGPALARGDVVVCDRYLESSVAYQGVGRGLGVDLVAGLSLWATGGLLPDLTVLLDVDPRAGLDRVGDRDRLEAEPLVFHDAVRGAFLDRAAAAPDRWLVVDATLPVADVAAAIEARVAGLLADRHAAGRPVPAPHHAGAPS